MHTEEEARKKWCPFVRQPARPDEGGSTFNRGSATDIINANNPDFSCNCIASACMAWRVHDKQWEEKADALYSKTGERPTAVSMSKKRGFCGLAGKP